MNSATGSSPRFLDAYTLYAVRQHTASVPAVASMSKAKQSKAKMCNGLRHVPLFPASANEKYVF